MNTSHKCIAVLAAAAALLLSLSSNAAERPGNSAFSKTVKTWDLDFDKTEDMQTFNARVLAAANDVCLAEARRHWSTTRRSVPYGWRERCVNDAFNAAVREVGTRRLAMR
jgi:UrcA family protein